MVFLVAIELFETDISVLGELEIWPCSLEIIRHLARSKNTSLSPSDRPIQQRTIHGISKSATGLLLPSSRGLLCTSKSLLVSSWCTPADNTECRHRVRCADSVAYVLVSRMTNLVRPGCDNRDWKSVSCSDIRRGCLRVIVSRSLAS